MSSISDTPLAERDTNADVESNSANLKLDIPSVSVSDDSIAGETASAVPGRLANPENCGKVVNSPRVGAPVDKSNDISAMSEFASEPSENKEDSRPLNERLVSKKWKDRKAAYEELKGLFDSGSKEAFSEYQGFLEGCAKDKFQACVADGFAACKAFFLNNKDFKDDENSVKMAILRSAMEGFKQKTTTVKEADELALVLFQTAQAHPAGLDEMVEALMGAKGVKNRNIKISSQSVVTLKHAVEKFGVPSIPLAHVIAGLKSIFESSHASTKKEGVQLMRAIFAHTRTLSMFNLTSLKPAMKKEIDEAVENVPPPAPVAKQAAAAALSAQEQGTAPPPSKPAPVDSGIMPENVWASLPAQEPSEKINGFLKTASKRDEKWKVRKEALEAATRMVLAVPRIKERAEVYGDAYDTIKLCLQDSTLWIRIAAMNLTRALAIGGRQGFSVHARRIVKSLFQWYKEKKMVHVNAVNECLAAIHSCILSLDDLYDEILKNTMPAANPSVIECTLAFVSKAILAGGQSAPLFSKDHALMGNLISTITAISTKGKTPALREAGAHALQTIIDSLGRDDSRVESMMDGFQTSHKSLFKKLSNSDASKPAKAAKRRPSTGRRSSGGDAEPSKPARRESSSAVASSRRGSVEGAKKASKKRQSFERRADGALTGGETTDALLGPAEAMEKLDEMNLPNWMDTKELLGSSKWQEQKRGMEIIQEALRENPDLVSENSEAIIVTVGAVTRNFKSSNFNIMNAAFGSIGTVATLCAEHSKPFPIATLKAFVPPACGKFGDRKIASGLHEMLLCVAQCVTPSKIVSRVLSAAANLRSPIQVEDVLTFLGTTANDFGANMLPLKTTLPYVTGDHGLGHKTPKVKSAAEALLTVLYQSVGAKVIRALEESDSQRAEGLAKKLKATQIDKTAQKIAKRKVNVSSNPSLAAGANDNEVAVKQTDLTDKVPKSLLAELHVHVDKKSWKTRQEAVMGITKILKSTKGEVECNKGSCRILVELKKALRNEKNANTEVRIAACMTLLVSKVGANISKLAKYAVKDVLLCLGSNNKKLVEEVTRLLDGWCTHDGEAVPACVDSILPFLPEQMKEKTGRLELALWMERFLPVATTSELKSAAILTGIFDFCQDKNSKTRKAAESVLGVLSKVCGQEAITDGFEKLHGVVARTLRPIVERAISGKTAAQSQSSHKERRGVPGKSNRRASASSIPKSTVRTKDLAAPSGSTVSKHAGKGSRRTSAPIQSSSKQLKKEDSAAILKVMPEKFKRRRELEASRRPWVLPDRPESPASDLTDKLRSNLEAASSVKFFGFAFSASSSQKLNHIGKACDMLKVAVKDEANKEAVRSNLDLIFKWATLHLDLKQASVLKSLQGMLLALLNVLKEDSYSLSEYEVSIIAPCLALHVGHKIQRFADNYRSMMKLISELHSPQKFAQFVLYGIDPRAIRNSISRKNNLEELARLVVKEGWQVVGQKGLRAIAGQIDSHESIIRESALLAICTAWEKLSRDSEKLLQCVGKSLSSKGETILKQRLEAKGGTPVPSNDSKAASSVPEHKRGSTVSRIQTSSGNNSTKRRNDILNKIESMKNTLRSPSVSPTRKSGSKKSSDAADLNVDIEAMLSTGGAAASDADDLAFKFEELTTEEVEKAVASIKLGVSIDVSGRFDDSGAESPLLTPSMRKLEQERSTESGMTDKVLKIIAVVDTWIDASKNGSATDSLDLECAEAAKNFNTLVFPNNDYQNVDPNAALEIAKNIPSILDRFCSIIEISFGWNHESNGLFSAWQQKIVRQVLVSFVSISTHKDLARNVDLAGLQRFVKICIKGMVDSRRTNKKEFELEYQGAFQEAAIRIIAHCDRTLMLQSLVHLLADSKVMFSVVAKMISKSLRREVKTPDRDGAKPFEKVDVDAVYHEIHALLGTHSVEELSTVMDATVLEAVDNILKTFCKFLGPPNWTQMAEPIPANASIRAMIAAFAPVSTERTPKGAALQVVVETPEEAPEKAEAPTPALAAVPEASAKSEAVETATASNDEVLKRIFQNISSKDSRNGVRELYEFKRQHPNVDVEPYMKTASVVFQKFIRTQLNRLEAKDRTAGATSAVEGPRANRGSSVAIEDAGRSSTASRRTSSEKLAAMKARLARLGATKSTAKVEKEESSPAPAPVPADTTSRRQSYRDRLQALKE